ncbi:MAG: type II secretion system ATPase GspE [Rhodocyclaceae bacterium]|jgi:general secretion pathway protein E|nr:type II secretion system ATPase GspE [Rhodocyclaceae bacterium]MBK6677652.1 type II secretion system ATPase GspE [Rhodocyclaceae bacterium]MBK7813034.1 type II secretion system ATPase GspE [Rhodocyclaceae bacterium]MBK9310327.1 type II secretion system ATPase GspE [Rhodocyclaceae bacterium]
MDPKISGEDRWLNNRRFGEILIDDGKLDAAGLDQALQLQKREPSLRIGELLVRAGLIRHADVAQTLSRQFSLPVAAARDYPEFPVLDDLISIRYVREARALPLAETPECLTLAMVVPQAAEIINAFRVLSGRKIEVRIAVQDDFDVAFERLYGGGRTAMGQIIDDIESVSVHDFDADDIQHLKDQASEAPVIRLVGLIIRKALDARASDIHIEPFENRLIVRYRIDGVMHEVESPPRKLSAAVISRVKIMSNLDIAERRLPQDGRIKLRIQGKEIDLRVSTVPTMHGESVVMRILDKGGVPLDFASLGFEPDLREKFTELLLRPHGILLVTGPTGSGKTTTLYTALSMLNKPDVKILTVEDPVEYQMDGINQIQVKPQIDLTFANALRSIVRQDPDVIMIGEIRDLETAQIAVQSALTGHMVLSTLHTNDAASSVNRLLDMGMEDYLLTSTVVGIQAQRLVRTLCKECRKPFVALPEIVAETGLGRYADTSRPVALYEPVGCAACAQTGYIGRVAIMEVMPMTDGIRSLVMHHATSGDIQKQAVAEGMLTMYEHGLRKVLAGTTTLGEVLRVTREV